MRFYEAQLLLICGEAAPRLIESDEKRMFREYHVII